MREGIKVILVLIGSSVLFAFGISLMIFIFDRTFSIEDTIETAIFWFTAMSLIIFLNYRQDNKKDK